jgi:D-amino-acid dehydrogenase
LRWMRDEASPFLVRPRADLEFFRWGVRFARSCQRPAHRAGTAAMLALARDTPELFRELREDGVSFEMHEDGLLYLARSEEALQGWIEMYEGLELLGFDGQLTILDRADLQATEPAVGDVPYGLLAGRECHVRPEMLVAGLVDHLRTRGVDIHEGAGVRRLHPSYHGWSVETTAGTFDAEHVVVAAGVWSREVLEPLGVKLPIEAAKGYSVTAHGPGVAPQRPLYLTEAKVGVSPFDGVLRLAGTLELSGMDLRLDRARVEAVARTASDYLRDWRPVDGRVDWAGLRPLAPDGLPIIGAVPGYAGLFVATGHGMLGITLAPATGEALAPLVLDGEQPPELYPLGLERFLRGSRFVRPTIGAERQGVWR